MRLPTNKVRSSRLLCCIAILLEGCATAPPPLPADTTSVDASHHLTLSDFDPADAALSCPQIADEYKAATTELETETATISANRTSDETEGFLAAVTFTPLLLAAGVTTADRVAYQKSYARRDKLRALASVKDCNLSG